MLTQQVPGIREYRGRAVSFTRRTRHKRGLPRRSFAKCRTVVQTIAARRTHPAFGPTGRHWHNLEVESMATDYDAPRKTEDDSESIEALKERVPDKMSGSVDVEDSDNPSGFELPGADLSDVDLDVVVLPPQEDEFTCVECFLVKHRTQIDHQTSIGAICTECAA
jgi:hypothetical protein